MSNVVSLAGKRLPSALRKSKPVTFDILFGPTLFSAQGLEWKSNAVFLTATVTGVRVNGGPEFPLDAGPIRVRPRDRFVISRGQLSINATPVAK